MKIESTPLKNVYVITPDLHEDAHGFLAETFRQDALEAAGISDTFVQDNHSHSIQKNTVRGLYFQWDKPMSKLMRVTRGAAFLVAVDLRKSSPTFGGWFGIEASEDNRRQLYAPATFARGSQTLTELCDIEYKCSAFYNSGTQGAIRWDDPKIGIVWPLSDMPSLSERSASAGQLDEWLSRSESDMFT